MHESVLSWVASVDEANARRVLEVGSYDVNGSVRPILSASADMYVGIDIVAGPGVDQVYDGYRIPFPDETFGLVVSTEMLEHCARPWRIVAEMARVCSHGGLVLITARGWVPVGEHGEVRCFGYHNPPDLWRYSGEAMRQLGEDAGLTVESVTEDPQVPGWFMACRRP